MLERPVVWAFEVELGCATNVAHVAQVPQVGCRATEVVRVLTVAEVALAAGVSPAAVRARLAEGALRGTQERRGNRLVWSVDPDSASAYVNAHGGNNPTASPPSAADPPVVQVAAWQAADPDVGGHEAVLAENVRLRKALAALTQAHRALTELVEVAFPPEP